MRRVEDLRRDEKFVFEPYGELLVAEDILPQPHPEVVWINGNAVLAVTAQEGEQTLVKKIKGEGLGIKLSPGEQLLGLIVEIGQGIEEGYTVGFGDKLVANRRITGQETEAVILPADEPIPNSASPTEYEVLGVVDHGERLISWGYLGRETRRLVDHLVAARIAEIKLDQFILSLEVGFYGPLGQRFAKNVLAQLYISEFHDGYNPPDEEPGQSITTAPGEELTRKLMERYY